MCRKRPFDEEILDGWLEQSNIGPPPSVRHRILDLIDEACQDLGKLGYKWEQSWRPVVERAGTYFSHINDYDEWVHEPIEDAERDRLREREEALLREKGKTIVIKLVNDLWPLYWDHVQPLSPTARAPSPASADSSYRLPGVVRIMRQPFHCRPFDEFSEEGYERIEVHEQRVFEGHEPPTHATPRAKRRRSLIDDPLAPTKKFIREYHAGDGGVSQKDLCERMATHNRIAREDGEPSPYPMPKGCKFSSDDDDWRRAYLDRDKRSSLCVWLTRRKRDS